MWPKIMEYLQLLSENAASLIHNVTNNQAEVLNSVVAKFIAGKRIFYSKRQSFNIRCGAAALSLNTSGQFQRVLTKKLQDKKSPGRFTRQHVIKRSAQLRNNRRRRAVRRTLARGGGRRRANSYGPDKDYGLAGQAPTADLDDTLNGLTPLEDTEEEINVLQARIHELMTKFQGDLCRREQIASCTQNTLEWEQERAFRLCASSFGRLCRRKPHTSAKNIVRDLVHGPHKGTAGSMKANFVHGHATEAVAIKKLKEKYGMNFVQSCGLFLDKEYPFLGASPDGLIGENRLLEVKCPISGESYSTLEEALSDKKIPYLTMDMNGNVTLNRRHDYFFQVQGQLRIAERESTLFYVFTTHWQKELIIERDDQFWKSNMEVQLVRFYKEAYLPEKLAPRFRKELKNVADIRDPQYILTEKEAYTTEKKRKVLEKEQNRKIRDEKRLEQNQKRT